MPSFVPGRCYKLFLGLLLVTLALGGCAQAQQAPTAAAPLKEAPAPKTTGAAAAAKASGAPIKIGYMTPMSGPVISFGHLDKVAMELAIEDINNSGGINGSPLEFILEDSPFSPKAVPDRVRKLAQDDKVFAIIGPYSTGEFQVAAPLAVELQVPMIGTKTTKPGMTSQNRPWSFIMTVHDGLTVPESVKAFKRLNPNVKKVVLAGDTKEAVTENTIRNLYPKALKDDGYEVLGVVEYESGTTDFSAVVTKIKGYNPEGLVYDATPTGNPVQFSKELERQGVKVPTLTGVHFAPGGFVTGGGSAMEGWLATTFLDLSSSDPKVQDFIVRFTKRAEQDAVIPKPIILTLEATTYDALSAIADIMRKKGVTANTPLPEARNLIKDGLASLKDYKGLQGTIAIDATGEAHWPPAFVVAKGGRWAGLKQ